MPNKTDSKARERRNKARRLLVKRRKEMRWELDSPMRRKSPGRRTIDRAAAAAKKAGDFLSTLTGLCILGPSGLLGYYTAERKFLLNAELSQALLDYTKDFLKAYESNPQAAGRRIGIIYALEKKQAWNTATLLMEQAVVRRLYPVQGQAMAELTVFQKKKQENSVYRGMELLLETLNEAIPGMPKYCPVLYDRGTTLTDYPSLTGKNFADKKVHVIEVLNLIAAMPINNHNTVKILEVIHNVHSRIVKKDLRKPPKFELINSVNIAPWSFQNFSSISDAQIDQHGERKISLAVSTVIDPPIVRSTLEKKRSYPLKQFEKWLEIPNRPVTVAALKKFLPFKNLNSRQLSTLAARSLVFSAPPGTLLLDRGTNDQWNLYLLSGQVALESGQEGRIVIEANSEGAASPIAVFKPRKYEVRTVTTVAFLWIHDAAIFK